LLNFINFATFDDNLPQPVRDNIRSILVGHKDGIYSTQVGSTRLGDRVTRRRPTDEERELLVDRPCDFLTEYRKALHGGVQCRSGLPVLPDGEEVRSDNRHIYTWDDQFCTISSIVALENAGVNEACGLFVDIYEVGDPVMGVNHIVPLTGERPTRQFVTMATVRNSAIKVTLGNETYVMPIPNQVELD